MNAAQTAIEAFSSFASAEALQKIGEDQVKRRPEAGQQ